MLYIFAIFMAVTLVTGGALLLVWRKDRTQTFTALLGLSHLVWPFNPLAYLATQSAQPHWHMLGLVGLVVLGSAYLSLLVLGVGHLSGRTFSRRTVWLLAAGLVCFHAGLIAVDMSWAQAGFASINTVVGLVLANWLRRLGPGERLTGLLLILCGFNQFLYVFYGEPAVMMQTTMASVLRLMLGMSLIYAAVTRSADGVKVMSERFFQLTERSHQGVAVVGQGRVAYVNPAFQQIYGMTPDAQDVEVFSRAWIEATVPADARDEMIGLARQITQGRLSQAEWEGERLALDGRRLFLRFKAWQVAWDGKPALQVVVSDETAHQEAARALVWRATHDELTGLPNRAALLQRLRDLFDDATQPAFALILLDVDRFKLFNEAHGHVVGDEVLKALSTLLTGALQQMAEVMRLGEDEFALLLTGPDADRKARTLTQLLKSLLGKPLVLTEHSFFLDVSMGVALHPSTSRNPEAVLQAATAAMYEAKRLPGTSAQWASDQAIRGLAAFFSAEQALRSGLHNDEFRLVYQPKVDASTGQLLGFEALVRWDRPGVGRINPMDFIPAAERNGLIVPLGALILSQACRQLALWRQQGLMTVPVAVNVSPLQLLDAEFPAAVMRTLKEHNIPPHSLTLEITETAAVTNMEQANEQITQLRQQGVEVALDDFGTGFSSLNMLRSLPLHTVKIDRSLIDPMPQQEAIAVVKAICDLAAVLQLKVVAEGVETVEHASAAREAGCDALQGYLFAKPLEIDDATRWLSDRY